MNLDPEYLDLRTRYPLETRQLEIAGGLWEITTVEDQNELVRRVRTEDDLANFPYGMMLWPSALGLAQAVLERPALIAGHRVLELGCGIGLAGLAAAASGAVSVTQTDFHKDALTLTRWNIKQNQGRLRSLPTVVMGDWRNFPNDLIGPYDLVVGADVLYERSVHSDLERLLPQLVGPAGQVLISDPMRPQSMDFLDQLGVAGGWSIDIDSVRANARDANTVTSPFASQEIALFVLQRCF